MHSIGGRCFVAASRPLQVKLKIRHSHLTTCGMAATGESHRLEKEAIEYQEETEMCTTFTWSANYICMKSTSLSVEAWAP